MQACQKGNVMALKAGEKIQCSRGHIVGSVSHDLASGAQITAHELRIDFDLAAITSANDGHECRTCGERVSRLVADAYAISTSRGWIGPQAS